MSDSFFEILNLVKNTTAKEGTGPIIGAKTGSFPVTVRGLVEILLTLKELSCLEFKKCSFISGQLLTLAKYFLPFRMKPCSFSGYMEITRFRQTKASLSLFDLIKICPMKPICVCFRGCRTQFRVRVGTFLEIRSFMIPFKDDVGIFQESLLTWHRKLVP